MMDEVKQSRRAWLTALVPKAVEAAARPIEQRIERSLPLRRRPPGAVSEPLFLASCTQCDKCMEACPHDAVFKLAPEAGIGAGTPVMKPDERACHMCEGFPCAVACPEQALTVPQGSLCDLGKVFVSEERCFTFRGPECGACGGLCPTDTPAIRFRLSRPQVDENVCVGCGKCIVACPTLPKALVLRPLRAQNWPERGHGADVAEL